MSDWPPPPPPDQSDEPEGPRQPPPPQPPPPYPPYQPYPQHPQQQYPPPPGYTSSRYNGLAIASLVVGILWIYWIGSILALVFGYIAKNQIKERGEQGSGMATAGIVLGWVGVGTLVLTILFFVIGSLSGGFDSSIQVVRLAP